MPRPLGLQRRPYLSGQDGACRIRVFYRKAHGKKGARYLLKCGCCEEKVAIYYGDGTLEINGVMGSAADWRGILEPLLKAAQRRSSKP